MLYLLLTRRNIIVGQTHGNWFILGFGFQNIEYSDANYEIYIIHIYIYIINACNITNKTFTDNQKIVIFFAKI